MTSYRCTRGGGKRYNVVAYAQWCNGVGGLTWQHKCHHQLGLTKPHILKEKVQKKGSLFQQLGDPSCLFLPGFPISSASIFQARSSGSAADFGAPASSSWAGWLPESAVREPEYVGCVVTCSHHFVCSQLCLPQATNHPLNPRVGICACEVPKV